MTVINHIYNKLNDDRAVISFFLVVIKAFDLVNYSLLLAKLERSNANNLICNFFKIRIQQVGTCEC